MVFSSNELDILILQNGKDGVSADSKYIWVKYSQYPDGSELTDDPTNAIYIGIAYNKDSIIESENPSDYSWTKIQGENGLDAYTVILSNENVSFAVDYDTHTTTASQSYSSTISVWQGTKERDDFVIGEIVSNNGITVQKTKNQITLSVEKGVEIANDHGSFRIPISIDGLVFFKDMTWNLSQQGKDGNPAINIIVGNEAQNIPCTENGVVSSGFLINIPFQGYIGTEKSGATAVVGLLPNGVTLGSNTPATKEEDGLIVLNVAKGADFGNASILTGDIILTFSIDNQQIVKYFTWSKTKDGSEGSMVIYELEASSYVISKNLDDTLTPESITFNAYSRLSNSIERSDYSGLFIIEESANGVLYDTKYLSDNNENTVTYTPSSSDIHSIRCTLCQENKVSVTLDRQTIPVLKDSDNLKPIIEEITTTMKGLETKVDNVEQSITNKVWQTDITNSINNYDGTTIKTIRDQVAEQEITIQGITQTVKDVQTEVEQKADGSTVSSLTEKVSQMEQDVNGFKTEVSETYVSKNDLEDALGNIEGQTGIDWKINYSDDNTVNNNWIYIFSKDKPNDGWIIWNTNKISMPEISVDTSVVEYIDIPIYIVVKIESKDTLVDNSKIYFVWFQNNNGWQSYNLQSKQISSWVWENESDAIIAMFSRTEQTKIDSAKLYTIPLMYNEIYISQEQKSYIDQTANHITQVVEETYATKDTVEQVRSEFTQTANEIKGTVEDIDGELSQVSQKADKIEQMVGSKKDVAPTAIRYIRDWLKGNNIDTQNRYIECQVMSGDTNIAKGITAKAFNENHQSINVSNIGWYTDGTINADQYITVNASGWVYIQLDLGSIRKDVDIIKIWHYYKDNRVYNHKLEVSSDGETWMELYNSEVQGGYIERTNGSSYNLNDSIISDNVSKITQTIDSITTRVQENEENYSQLEQTVNGFKTEVSETYATKSEMQSSIEQSAESINTTIANIRVGTRNLALGTCVSLKSTSYLIGRYTLSEEWVEGETYTISFVGEKIAGNFAVYRDNGQAIITNNVPYNPKTKRYEYTFTCPVAHVNDADHRTISFYNYPSSTASNTTISNVKLEKGNKATDWVIAPEDLASGGTNLLFNSNFNLTSESETGTNKHPNIYATRWGGYNSGISNPTTSYHAHVNDETFGYNVMEFNESNGVRNLKNIAQQLSTIGYVANSYIFSFDAYATGTGGKIYGGFYYTKTGSASASFASGQYEVTTLPINKWGRCFVKVPLNNDVDFSKAINFYVYGYNFTSNIIVYIKNIKLEEGVTATSWCPSPEDTEDSILTVQETAAGIVSQVTSLAGQLSRLEQTSDAISAEIESARGSSASLSIALDSIMQRIQDAEGDYSSIVQTVNGISININEVQNLVNDMQNTLNSSFDFTASGLVISSNNSTYNVLVSTDGLYIRSGSENVAWINSSSMHIDQAIIETSLTLGKFAFKPEANGSLSFGIF